MSAAAVELRRWARTASLFLLGVGLAACSFLNHPWQSADKFIAGLRCKMSEAEVRTYSDRFTQLQIRDPEGREFLVAWKGNTQILLWFGPTGLTAHQVTWTYPLTNFDSRLKTDLCSGTRYVNLNLIGDAELGGATVWLDGERVGELSAAGNFTRDVPLGVHHLRIERPGGGSWRTELRYDEADPGHDRVVVPGESRKPR